uniref:B30.2/SPRY domain-containing protein n=1 Tax=Marmota marmota marmota TaxID=9994 RepID=A0A8C5YTP0_MARMA
MKRQKQLLADEKMKQLIEETEVLAHEIKQLHMELKEDDISFLMSSFHRLFCTVEPEPIQPSMLINPCWYLDSLQYRVWKKMISSIKSVPFSFDPNTAAGWLSVSDDLTSTTNHGYCLQVENPECFSSASCLLGSCTFSQGSHSWRVGVVRVQPDTGAEGHSHSCYHDTHSGFWYVCHTQGVEGDHCVTLDPATSPLVPTILCCLRVELECEEGELSFYDAEHNCHLYTFHARFGEVRPYFYLGGVRGDGPPEPLSICPLCITIKEELDV